MTDENHTNGGRSLIPLVLLIVMIGGGVLWFSCQFYEKLGFSVGMNIAATIATWIVAILLSGVLAVKLRACDWSSLKGILTLTLLLSAPLLFFTILFTVLGYAPF
jgi:ABC-type Co2+ transport system permease subunit